MTAESLARDAGQFCKRTWWVFLIGGIASVAFGILAFANPAIALLVLGLFFAAYLLVDGVANILGAIAHRDKDGWWLGLGLGIVGCVVGAYLIAVPPVTMVVLIYYVAFMALFLGITTIMLGWRVRLAIAREWILYLTGAVSVLFGLWIALFPGIGGLSVIFMIATWAILTGALRIAFALRIRKLSGIVGLRLSSAL